MSVPFTNATVTITFVNQPGLSDSTLDNPQLDLAAVTTGIPIYLEEMTASEMFQSYNVQLQNPAIMQMEIANAKALLTVVGGDPDAFVDAEVKVTASAGLGSYVGRIYRIAGRGDWHDDGLVADHAAFHLDRKTIPL